MAGDRNSRDVYPQTSAIPFQGWRIVKDNDPYLPLYRVGRDILIAPLEVA